MSTHTVDGDGDGIADPGSTRHGECLKVKGKTMSSINGVGSNSPIQKIVSNPIQKSLPTEAPAQSNKSDRVELSSVNGYLQTLKTNDIRHEKVAAIKAQIEAGTYETDDKLDGAADKMLDDMFG